MTTTNTTAVEAKANGMTVAQLCEALADYRVAQYPALYAGHRADAVIFWRNYGRKADLVTAAIVLLGSRLLDCCVTVSSDVTRAAATAVTGAAASRDGARARRLRVAA